MTLHVDGSAGWAYPRHAETPHWFPAYSTVSLCGQATRDLYRTTDDDERPARDDCAVCALELAAMA